MKLTPEQFEGLEKWLDARDEWFRLSHVEHRPSNEALNRASYREEKARDKARKLLVEDASL